MTSRSLVLPLVLVLAFACTPPADPPSDKQCDECGVCDTDPSNDCVADCAGVFGGSATRDDCGECVGGDTGKTACEADCAGVVGGSATRDECGVCDADPSNDCTQDCHGDWGGTATIDTCDECVGGNTGKTACVQDCHGDWGGTALIDGCGVCAGGGTGVTACAQDCLGEWGGAALVDECGVCDADPSNDCTPDCNGDWGGTATLDTCDVCVGGLTGLQACAEVCPGVFHNEGAPLPDEDEDGVHDGCDVCPGIDDATGPVLGCRVCSPYMVSLATQYVDHPFYFSFRASSDSAFGKIAEVSNGSLTWFFSGATLHLPPGTYDVTWRAKGTPNESSFLLETVAFEGCAEQKSLRWIPSSSEFSESPAVRVTVDGPGHCTVRASMMNTVEPNGGLQIDWVRASPVCSVVADCPAMPGATRTECSAQGRCVYDAPDDDGDGICNALDLCPGEDDLVDADRDRFPDACECNAANAAVNPRQNDVCDALDNDCNGISAPTQPVGERYVSIETMSRVHPDLYVTEDSGESIFGRVLRITSDRMTWVQVNSGPFVWLQPGRYVADWRVAPGRDGDEPVALSIWEGNPHRPCVTRVDAEWRSPTTDGSWQITSPVAFEVTTADCPVHTSFINGSNNAKDTAWKFDWMRVRHACDADADCPSIGGSGAVCLGGACSYGEVCE